MYLFHEVMMWFQRPITGYQIYMPNPVFGVGLTKLDLKAERVFRGRRVSCIVNLVTARETAVFAEILGRSTSSEYRCRSIIRT